MSPIKDPKIIFIPFNGYIEIELDIPIEEEETKIKEENIKVIEEENLIIEEE